MLLKLEVVGAHADRRGERRSKIFATEGGTIGRVPGNDWVLADQCVSSRHAAIQYADGQFYVIDTNSSNGVFLNGPSFRLEQGRPYPINTGDRLLIDPFDIHVAVIESAAAQEEASADMSAPETLNVSRPAPSAPSRTPAVASDPFAVEEEVAFVGTVPKAPPPQPQSSRAPAPPPGASAPVASGPGAGRAQLDFAALLTAAGLQGVPETPDLSGSFGSILKVVVDGLRDVLRAREELKEQFRLRITSVAARENNPIKFSANTEDALHNLLVRHNPAYLEPVAAFESAFDDLRIHQMAMLAGLRAGYQAMVTAFDPDTLEEKFERYVRRGGILGASAKPRYWDLYREVFEETTGDPDDSFRTLFGTAFSKAYEEQTRLLKQRSRGQ
jgi:type VI secretion system protein ImpI